MKTMPSALHNKCGRPFTPLCAPAVVVGVASVAVRFAGTKGVCVIPDVNIPGELVKIPTDGVVCKFGVSRTVVSTAAVVARLGPPDVREGPDVNPDAVVLGMNTDGDDVDPVAGFDVNSGISIVAGVSENLGDGVVGGNILLDDN